MNDCPNVDVRDLLPDLVNGRLHGDALRAVEAHVASCADCRAELALLREVRASVRTAPVVDVGAIAAALPSYRAPARRSWVGWRVAAAITVVAAGASSLVVIRGGPRLTDTSSTVVVGARRAAPVPASPAQPADSAIVQPQAPRAITPEPRTADAAVPAAERELAMTGGALTDLSDRELATLLKDIESMDVLPTVEVESASLAPLSPRRGAP